MYLNEEVALSIQCLNCSHTSHNLIEHVQSVHGIDPASYKGPLLSPQVLAKMGVAGVRTPAPSVGSLTTDLMGFKCPVNPMIGEDDCLAMPDNYRFPTKGNALVVAQRAMMFLLRGLNFYLWGMPGTGKDALIHAFSAATRRPCVMLSFCPGKSLDGWFHRRAVGANGTYYEYGILWDVLTKGVKGKDGRFYPAIILLSDVDRADVAQAELLRTLTDSIQGRVMGPDGKMHPVLKGTQFVCTANSPGSGDSRGRSTSANVIDASIRDRLGQCIQAAYLHWDDECVVLKAKFPNVNERAPKIFPQLGKATDALRAAIEKQTLYAEFTHRGICAVLAEVDAYLAFNDTVPANILSLGFRSWLDGLDEDTRMEAIRIIDPFVKSGIL